MKIAIAGAGFTGLSVGFFLAEKGHQVTIFEKAAEPGGLVTGFKEKNWAWPLENYYHHFFASDAEAINLARQLGIKVNFFKTKTSIFTPNEIFPLDSPISLLKFPDLDIVAKLRMGATLGYLKFSPFWQPLEKETTKSFLTKTMGTTAWQTIWQPLLAGKFGKYADGVPASWFWARIKKRSVKLGYPERGFATFTEKMAQTVEKMGGKIYYATPAPPTEQLLRQFDRVITTIPAGKVPFLAAVNLVLRLKKPFLPDNVYWLNIGVPGFPFLSVVEHTHFISPQNYGGEHLVYVGQYLPAKSQEFLLTKEEILKKYHSDLLKINPDYQANLIGFEVFRAPLAQPVFPLNYSLQIPPLITKKNKIYSATMEQVYPWDRGTNYAIALGKKVAKIIIQEK